MSKKRVLTETQMRAVLAARRDAAGGIQALAYLLGTTRQNLSPMINQGKPVSKDVSRKSGFILKVKKEYELIELQERICDACGAPEINESGDVVVAITLTINKGSRVWWCTECHQGHLTEEARQGAGQIEYLK